MIKVNSEEQRRLSGGDVRILKEILNRELEDIKESLLHFKPGKYEYDYVLKGRGSVVKDLLELLKNC